MSSELKFTPIDDEHSRYIISQCKGQHQHLGYVEVKPSDCYLNVGFTEGLDKILNFQVFPDDVWVVTLPKSGTTWSQEMTWLLMNDLNFDVAKTTPLTLRSPFIEFEMVGKAFKSDVLSSVFSVNLVNKLPRPRCIKSHLPVQLLPKQLWTVKPKIIYVIRDPRDTVISFYNHHRYLNDYSGTFEQFTEAYLASRVLFLPHWENVLEFWKLRNEPNIIFNTYESMKKDLMGTVMKTAKFLGKSYTKEQLEKLCEHLSFDQMKKNQTVNMSEVTPALRASYNRDNDSIGFIRRGISGGWKTEMNQDLQERFTAWTTKYLSTIGYTSYESFAEDVNKINA